MPFPVELWVHIVRYVEPRDLCNLSQVRRYSNNISIVNSDNLGSHEQTSRFLHSVIGQREVWIEAIRTAIWRYHLAINLPNIETLDLDQLQRIALRPNLWDELVNANTHDPGQLGPVLSPKSTITVRPKGLEAEETISLIAGGRYLLTMAQENLNLKLWDLGPPGKGLESPVLVADDATTWVWNKFDVQVFRECIRVAVGVDWNKDKSL